MNGGRLVCVMGVDGSGKSTAAQSAVELLGGRGIEAMYLWNRWEPRMLAGLTGGANASSGETVRSDVERYAQKRKLLANALVRFLWLLASSLDYSMSGAGKTRAAIRSGTVVVCDRYVPDFVIDQTMNIGGGSSVLERVAGEWALKAFPRPCGNVLIDVEAHVALDRKDDGLSEQVACEKVALYREYARLTSATVIDGSHSPDVVAVELADAVEILIGRCG